MKNRQPRPWTLFEGMIALAPGQEWHSPSLNIRQEDAVNVEAVSQREFWIGLYQQEAYLQRFEAGTPFWEWPKLKWSEWTKTRKAKKSETYRVVIRVGSHSPPAAVRLTITIQEPTDPTASGSPAASPHEQLWKWDGVKWGPFKVWDAVESTILGVTFAILVLIIGLVNVEVLGLQWPLVSQGGTFAVSLFQADAEWAIFLAALYVALKSIPQWISQRRETSQ